MVKAKSKKKASKTSVKAAPKRVAKGAKSAKAAKKAAPASKAPIKKAQAPSRAAAPKAAASKKPSAPSKPKEKAPSAAPSETNWTDAIKAAIERRNQQPDYPGSGSNSWKNRPKH